MKSFIAPFFAVVLLSLSGVLAEPLEFAQTPAPGTQPGCGPAGCHNPTGTFGLIRQPRKYHHLCEPHSFLKDHRPRACFDTQLELERALSAPSPRKLHGYIDETNTNFVLFAGQIITLKEKYEIHVDEAVGARWKWRGCSHVKIYALPKWVLEVDEIWCPGHNQPIAL